MLIEHFSTLNGWSMKGSKAICGLLKKRKKSKPGGLEVETNRDRDRERPSCRD